ncbi:MAG: tRNA 2-thiouridine(34) synthase MnmA [Clostridia bacterium]|nr:tRNA 2-thiouridine(34) synthase MnmA [Clostridia bacterium]
MNKTVVVGMSGGVDSSVTAYLLKKEGYNVIGVTMKTHDTGLEEIEDSCCGLTGINDARRVCDMLEIPHYVMNFKKEFKEDVIDYFIEDYRNGYTPNPCIACNKHIKWEALLRKAKALGADYIATGHFGKIEQDENNGRYFIRKSDADRKDQSYVLYNLSQDQLKHTLMPLGNGYTKEKVREVAKEMGLSVANKPDSQDICFVPDGDYVKFITENSDIDVNPGNFVNKKGEILGRHKGIIRYTIGQRKGLEIAFGEPMYVIDINTDTNEVVLGTKDEVFSNIVYATELNFAPFDKLEGEMTLEGKIRYSHKPSKCKIYMVSDNVLKCEFEEPQRAVTPGQAIVFYDGDIVVGGGRIINERQSRKLY